MNQKDHKEYLRKTKFPSWHTFIEEITKYDYDVIMKVITNEFKEGHQKSYCICCKAPIRVYNIERFKVRQLLICQICYLAYYTWLTKK